MADKYFLGVDVGTTALKAALFDDEGNKVVHCTQEFELLKPLANYVEQKPELYLEVLKRCVKEVVLNSGIEKEKIVAMAMDSSAETIVFLDRNMQPLDNFYIWLDGRAEAEADEINAYFSQDELMKNTGQIAISPIYPAAKILWFKKNRKELFEKISMMFMPDDYILWQLCGKMSSHASSWCTSYLWNLEKKEWWSEMLEFLGITKEQLPEIVETGTPVGKIDPQIAKELGVSEELLLVMGAQDQNSGAIGVGNVIPGLFSESTGGALMVCTMSKTPVFDAEGHIPCNYGDYSGTYMLQGGAMGGIMTRWLRDTLCIEELRLEKEGKENAYERMDQLAGQTPPGAEGLFLLPWFGGAGDPDYDIYGRGVLYGLSLGHTKGHIIRAFMEALACNIERIIEYTEKLTGVTVTQIRSLGGGSLSKLWCQIKADITGREVVTMKNTQDAACLGAAIIAGYGYGAWDSIEETAIRFSQIDKVYEPDPANREIYDNLLEKFDLLVEALSKNGYTERLSR